MQLTADATGPCIHLLHLSNGPRLGPTLGVAVRLKRAISQGKRAYYCGCCYYYDYSYYQYSYYYYYCYVTMPGIY